MVAHPGKVEREDCSAIVRKFAGEREVLWFGTTAESPGTEQAREALARGARCVIAAGGDGTVRAVAQALVGTGVPLGILPLGTGNLLARNLALPLTDMRTMADVAIRGKERSIDVGRVSAWDEHGQQTLVNEAFCVIAGLGFDAIMVESTDPALKARLGWAAYLLSGLANLKGPRVQGKLTVDGEENEVVARSIMVGNCGLLPAGLTLIPDATLDDGHLDIALCDTRAGLAGWASLAAKVALQGLGYRVPPVGPGILLHRTGMHVHLAAEDRHPLQLDGELVGYAQAFETRIEPGSLVVRTAR